MAHNGYQSSESIWGEPSEPKVEMGSAPYEQTYSIRPVCKVSICPIFFNKTVFFTDSPWLVKVLQISTEILRVTAHHSHFASMSEKHQSLSSVRRGGGKLSFYFIFNLFFTFSIQLTVELE